MSTYKLSKQSFEFGENGTIVKAFAPINQTWQKQDGDDEELTITPSTLAYNESANNWELKNLSPLTAELFNSKATIHYDATIRALFGEQGEIPWISDGVPFIIINDQLARIVRIPKSAPSKASERVLVLNGVSGLGEDTSVQANQFLTHLERIVAYDGYPVYLAFVTQNIESDPDAVFAMQDGKTPSVYNEQTASFDPLKYPCAPINHYLVRVDANNAIALANSTEDVYLRDENGKIVTDTNFDPILIADLPEGYRIFDKRTIIRKQAPSHPFYVRWINNLGGYDYWMFACRQYLHRELSSATTYEPYIDDTRTATADRVVIAQDAKETMAVSSGMVNANEWEVISRICYSPKIQLYDRATQKWIDIILEKGSAEKSTAAPTGEIQLTFTLPAPRLQV